MDEEWWENDPYQSPQVRETPLRRQLQCTIQEYCWRAVGRAERGPEKALPPTADLCRHHLVANSRSRTRELQVPGAFKPLTTDGYFVISHFVLGIQFFFFCHFVHKLSSHFIGLFGLGFYLSKIMGP